MEIKIVLSLKLKVFTKRLNIRIDFSFCTCSGNELNINAPCVLKDSPYHR